MRDTLRLGVRRACAACAACALLILLASTLGAADLAGLVEQMQQHKLAGDEAAVARLVPLVRAELEQNHGPFAALAWNQLGLFHNAHGEFGEAERAFRRAIKLAESEGQNGVASVALLNLALDYLTLGSRPAEAEALLRRGLSKATAEHGAGSSASTMFLHPLATARQQQGDRPGALLYYERALALAGENREDQVNRGYILVKMAALHFEKKDWSVARDSLLKGIALIERYLGPTHPDVIAPTVSLAKVYGQMRQWGPANAALDRAEHVTELRLGSAHWLLVEVLTCRADLLRRTGHRGEGKKLDARAKAIAASLPRNDARDSGVHVSDLLRK